MKHVIFYSIVIGITSMMENIREFMFSHKDTLVYICTGMVCGSISMILWHLAQLNIAQLVPNAIPCVIYLIMLLLCLTFL